MTQKNNQQTNVEKAIEKVFISINSIRKKNNTLEDEFYKIIENQAIELLNSETESGSFIENTKRLLHYTRVIITGLLSCKINEEQKLVLEELNSRLVIKDHNTFFDEHDPRQKNRPVDLAHELFNKSLRD